MPFALLLQQTFHRLYRRTRRLEAWNRLVVIEAALADRARSAFLVAWFGRSVPVEALGLRVAIANLAELKARYEEEMRLAPAGPGGLNLTEPLAGMAGTLVGAMLSPTGMLLTVIAFGRSWPWWVNIFWYSLGAIVFMALGPVVAAVLGTAGTLGGAAMALGAGLVNEPAIHAVYDLLGSLATLLRAAGGFLNQLTGPRAEVRNPLLRRLLELGDAFARVVPFVLALFAVFITRFGPLFGTLAGELRAIAGLVRAAMDTLRAIVDDFKYRLASLFANETWLLEIPLGGGIVLLILLSFQGALIEILEHATGTVEASLRRLLGALGKMADAFFPPEAPAKKTAAPAKAKPDSWLDQMIRLLKQAFDPFNEMMERLSSELQIARRLLASASGGASSAGGGGLMGHVQSLFSLALGPVPPFPKFPGLPDPDQIAGRLGGWPALGLNAKDIKDVAKGIDLEKIGPPFVMGDAAKAALERTRHPASVFAAEGRSMTDADGRTLEQQLEAVRARDRDLRGALFAVLEQALPTAVTPYVAQLHDLLTTLDERIEKLVPSAQPAPKEATPHPVLGLAEPGRLKPVVRRLRVRVVGSTSAAASDWAERLRRAMLEQSYPEAAGG